MLVRRGFGVELAGDEERGRTVFYDSAMRHVHAAGVVDGVSVCGRKGVGVDGVPDVGRKA